MEKIPKAGEMSTVFKKKKYGWIPLLIEEIKCPLQN